MTIITQFKTASDFWSGMVQPDYQEYSNNKDNLRFAFHAAVSLYHMSDWVFHTHEATVKSIFTYQDKSGNTNTPLNEGDFATALEQQHSDFGIIRGIANGAKHLRLHKPRPIPGSPQNAGYTVTKDYKFGEGGFGQRPYGITEPPKVMILVPGGSDIDFSHIADNIYSMWLTLKNTYSW